MAAEQTIAAPVFLQDEAFGHWLSGFVDGEGCFNLQMKRVASRREYEQAVTSFILSLRADDGEIVNKIHRYFGCGTVIHNKPRRTVRDGKPQVRYSIDAISDLANRVIPHFERFPLRAKKARDYEIWKAAVRIRLTQSKHWSIVARDQFRGLVRELRRVREFSVVIATPQICTDQRQRRLWS